jgi:hypothetical protein
MDSTIQSRSILEEFTLPNATHYGGFNLLSDFATQLGLDKQLERRFSEMKAPWSVHSMPLVLRYLIDGYALGMERVWHFEDLEKDPLLLAKRGVDSLPDHTTLYRDLERFRAEGAVERLKSVSRPWIRKALKRERRGVLEFDTVVETVYGQQEGAVVGYNPHKRGRPSYKILICRERLSGLNVGNVLKPGNTGDPTDFRSFLEEVLSLRPRWKRWLARLDAGFGYESVLSELERHRGLGYVVKLRLDCALQKEIWKRITSRWRKVETADPDEEVEVLSFDYHPEAWSRARRVVVQRRKNPANPQGHLWDGLAFNYSAYVTDRMWAEQDVVAFYYQRAAVETHVCELRDDLGTDRITSQWFAANAADLELKCLAHNLLVLFQRHVLGLDHHYRAKTIRRRFLHVVGKVVRHSGQVRLKLDVSCPWREKLPTFRERLAAFA